jgi:DNA-binding NarL/FixJ family response regulator
MADISVDDALKCLHLRCTGLLGSLAVSSLKLSSTKRPIRILVVERMELIRVGLVQIISAVSNLVVCAMTGGCDDVADLVERHRPRLVIVEPFQENGDGIMWIKDLAARFPQTRILVASSKAEITYAERALRAGASGYWMKTGTADELLRAIDKVLNDEIYVSPKIALLAVDRLAGRNLNGCEAFSDLTDRELHVFSLIGAGHGVGWIAEELGISRKTVETYCERIKSKLGYPDAGALKRGARHFLAAA